METLILLDVDGVLNPAITRRPGEEHPTLTLTTHHKELLTHLSQLGTITWATSHDAAATRQLDKQAGLTDATLRIPLTMLSSDEMTAPTPKLGRIIRWIHRTQTTGDFPWTQLIWIDDHHGPDATAWTIHSKIPALLITPNPGPGLTTTHLHQAQQWARNEK